MRNVHRQSQYRRRGRSGPRARASENEDFRNKLRAVKLVVCVGIFVLAAAIKLIFPASVEKVESKVFRAISGDVDYRAAIEAVGRGIGGETGIKEALSDAWIYAFVQDGGVEPADTAVSPDAEEV